jgi:hypothetical protein
MQKHFNLVVILILIFSMFSSCARKPFVRTVTPKAPIIPITPIETTVTVTIKVSGDGKVEILGSSSLCDKSADCPVRLTKNSETEFQAIFDESTGLQLVGFTGCTSLEADGTICRITATSDTVVTVVFSKPPVANFLYQDDGSSVVYISLYDEQGNALTYDPEGSLSSVVFTSNISEQVKCTAGGDMGSVVANEKCLTGNPDYIFALAADSSIADLTITLVAKDAAGLTATFQERIRTPTPAN